MATNYAYALTYVDFDIDNKDVVINGYNANEWCEEVLFKLNNERIHKKI